MGLDLPDRISMEDRWCPSSRVTSQKDSLEGISIRLDCKRVSRSFQADCLCLFFLTRDAVDCRSCLNWTANIPGTTSRYSAGFIPAH